MDNVAEADADVGEALKEEFLAAAGGCKSKAAKIFIGFLCRAVPLYPDVEKMKAFYKEFLTDYPSLAVVLYTNFKPFVFPALVKWVQYCIIVIYSSHGRPCVLSGSSTHRLERRFAARCSAVSLCTDFQEKTENRSVL